jgi:putative PIN family toxin of toxin-antitoxin system
MCAPTGRTLPIESCPAFLWNYRRTALAVTQPEAPCNTTESFPVESLGAWQKRRFILVLPPAILGEYHRVLHEMTKKRPLGVLNSILEVMELHSEMIDPNRFSDHVCSDPDDDKFIEAAFASDADYVVTGDAALLNLKNYQGIQIVAPPQFLAFLNR